jgi:hypothetical protein
MTGYASAAGSRSSSFFARRTQDLEKTQHKHCTTTMLTPLPGGSGGDPYAAIIKDCVAATKAAMQVCSTQMAIA